MSPVKKTGGRLRSLDSLRGFDMFWIVSGEGIVHGLASAVKNRYGLLQDPVNWQIAVDGRLNGMERAVIGFSNQLHHSVWNGFSCYDLIFPLFIFIAGVSMPFSFAKSLERNPSGRRKLYRSLVRRSLLLIALGMVVNGALQWEAYEHTRFASVLGRIALSCFFAAVIYLNSSLRGRILWAIGLLLGYWLLLTQVPVPGFGRGLLTPEGNLTAWFDRSFLPGKLHREVYDPEGLLSTVPAIVSALLGVLAGEWLRRRDLTGRQKTVGLLAAGLLLLGLGLLWGRLFPINKTLWSSSFVLVAGGWSLLLLALFYLVIDVMGYKNWCAPLVWMGCNSILIYMLAHGLVNFKTSSAFIFGGLLQWVPSGYQDALIWTGVALIQFALLYFLYRKKIFLKL